jgi:hypothetical protein
MGQKWLNDSDKSCVCEALHRIRQAQRIPGGATSSLGLQRINEHRLIGLVLSAILGGWLLWLLLIGNLRAQVCDGLFKFGHLFLDGSEALGDLFEFLVHTERV